MKVSRRLSPYDKMITLIAAIGKNNELGKGNDLVWKLPADQKHFRERTTGHAIIMGRKTFESLGRPLPNRKNIVITRDKNYLRPADAKALAGRHGVDVVHSLDEAIKSARTTLAGTTLAQNDEIFIIGGAEIFNQAMNIADRLDITRIEAEDKKADTFFPKIIPIVWNEISHEKRQKDEKNPLNYTFSIYERI